MDPKMDRVEFGHIPDYGDVKLAIDKFLLEENWTRYKISRGPKQFVKRLNRLFLEEIKIVPQIIIPDHVLPSFLFYRARVPNRSFNKTLISDYSYPPNHVIRSYQRCNIPYHPVFYCSNDPHTTILETAHEQNDLKRVMPCYVSEWCLRQDAKVNVTPFVFGNIPKGRTFFDLSEANVQKLRDLAHEFPEDKIEAFVKIHWLLSSLFLFDNTYSISSFIAHHHLYAPHNYRSDIFMYPSIKTNLNGVNFAIHPNCVQHKMVLKKIYKMYISKINVEKSEFTARITHTGINSNGTILWREFKKEEDINSHFVSSVFPKAKK